MRFPAFLAASHTCAVHFAGILTVPRIRAVRFPCFLASRLTRAVHFGAFPAAPRTRSVHFPYFPAASHTCAVRFPRFLAAGRILVVHFAGILAAPLIRAVHFPAFPAARRALRPIPCRGTISCKEIGEVHVERPAGRPFRRALQLYPCRQPCTSPVSLHEFAAMQGFGGNARQDARIRGKCTSLCRNTGEVHVPVQEEGRSAWHRAGIEGKCTAARPPPARALAHSPKTLQTDARPEPISGRPPGSPGRGACGQNAGRPPGPPGGGACGQNAGRVDRSSVKPELVRMGGVYLQLDTI